MSRFGGLFTGTPEGEASARAAAPRYRLLFVDDEPNVLSALRRIFRQENYDIVTAPNAAEGLALLEAQSIQLVISDFKMPGMNGADFLKAVKERHPDTMRIMLTGHADTSAVMGAIKDGAVYKFILKPWHDDDLRVTVALALEQYDLRLRNRQLQQENVKKAKEIGALAKLSGSHRSQLAMLLHKRGLLSDKQLQELYKLQQSRKESMLRVLLAKGWIAESAIRELLQRELIAEVVQLAEFQVDAMVTELVPHSYCVRNGVLPLKLDGRRLLLAMADPLDTGLIDELRFVSGLDVQPVMADFSAIERKIAEAYGSSDGLRDASDIVDDTDPMEGIEIVIEDDDSASLEELLRSTEEPPAIRLVNAILLEALRLGASDIHIHPRAKSVVVRYRIDGLLSDKIQIPHHVHPALISRIKVMAELDITERRRPQDGRITVKTPLRIVDLRISTLPTLNGEKVVMRVLDRNSSIQRIEGLGFEPEALTKVLHMVAKPQGIILATGPTGSGKTTTLYSLLQHEATPTRNYVTLEDPVEFYMDAAGQVFVRDKIGLSFATVLRAVLRQDPDVILLGEIRDHETAEVAFHAALTGHLVLSTLHTNSATATVARLMDLGLRPFVVASALEGIIAQRLVRRVCTHCREAMAFEPGVRAKLGAIFADYMGADNRGRGCEHCHGTGYRGRLALYEVMLLNDELRERIAAGAALNEIYQAHRRAGGVSLLEDGREKVACGLTSCDELLRVLGPQAY